MSACGSRLRWHMRHGLAAVLIPLLLWLLPPQPPLSITQAARSIQPGELVVLTITTVEPADQVRARAFDRDMAAVRVDLLTWKVLVGLDLDTAPGPQTVMLEALTNGVSVARATHRLQVAPKAFPTRNLSVNDAFVNPPATVQSRIEQEARDLEKVWAGSATSALWSSPFVRPVPDQANSAFGSRSVFNGQARSPHSGADFLSPAGAPIHAPSAGRIVLARDLYFSGNTVIIDHGLGLFSFLCHMSAIDVKERDLVQAGDILGKVGATGRVTGPHLHWAVRLNGARIDPLSVLAMLGDSGR